MSPEFDALRQIQSKQVPSVKVEIGPVLKAARLKKGLAVEAVARQTRISKRYLDALEADRFDEFPALVYLRGFLKGYCDFLEIEFDPLWAQVESAAAPAPAPAPTTEPAPPPAPAAKPKPQTKAEPAPEPVKHHAPAAHPADRLAPHGESHGGGATGAIAFSVVLAAGLGWWMFSHRAAPAPAPVSEPPKALQPLPAAVEPVVTLRLKDDAWLKVTLDGQPVFEGRAPRGSSQEWKPLKSLGLRTTSPEAVSLELNGAPRELGTPGPDGEYRIDIQ